jgi:hypothetical protein
MAIQNIFIMCDVCKKETLHIKKRGEGFECQNCKNMKWKRKTCGS